MSCGTVTHGRERPLDSGGANFFGGDSLHLLDERGIARAAEADVVREDHRAQHVVVAVHGVDAVEDRDLQARLLGARLEAVVEVGPGLQGVPFLGSELPPLNTEPESSVSMSDGSFKALCSGWVIWPIFSSSVICARSGLTWDRTKRKLSA